MSKPLPLVEALDLENRSEFSNLDDKCGPVKPVGVSCRKKCEWWWLWDCVDFHVPLSSDIDWFTTNPNITAPLTKKIWSEVCQEAVVLIKAPHDWKLQILARYLLLLVMCVMWGLELSSFSLVRMAVKACETIWSLCQRGGEKIQFFSDHSISFSAKLQCAKCSSI